MDQGSKVQLIGHLGKVSSTVKGDILEGQVVIAWNLNDHEKFGQLSAMQSSVVHITIEDRQQKLYEDRMESQHQDEPDLFEGDAEVGDGEDSPQAEAWTEEDRQLVLEPDETEIEGAEFEDVPQPEPDETEESAPPRHMGDQVEEDDIRNQFDIDDEKGG